MKIQSNFKDYMDGCQGLGFDDSTVWNRHTQIRRNVRIGIGTGLPRFGHRLKSKPQTDIYAGDPFEYQNQYRRVIIGYCGKIYPIYAQMSAWFTSGNTSRELFQKPLSTIESINCFVGEMADKKSLELFNKVSEPKLSKWERKFTALSFNKKNIEAAMIPKANHEIFQKLGVASFVYFYTGKVLRKNNKQERETYLILNPKLKDLGFQKVLDPYTAYQEASMFIGGVLTNIEEPPQITNDKILAAKHGFNNKSFRMASPGKKRKRRKK